MSVTIASKGAGKAVGVKPVLTGILPSGVWISEIKVNPATVFIKGSESATKDIFYLETKPIDISNLKESQTIKTELTLPKKVSLEEGYGTTVEVEIKIASVEQTKEVPAVINFSNLGDKLKVSNMTPKTISVQLAGPATALATASSDNVSVNLDLAGLGAGTHLLLIRKDRISAPANCTPVNFLPNKVLITIEEEK